MKQPATFRAAVRKPVWRFVISLAVLAPLLALVTGGQATGGSQASAAPASATAFADKAFQQLWERTDAPVKSGKVQRSWYWGPEPGTPLSEPYSGSKSGERLVQYFDKARMEINDPNGNRSSDWFVTTGLLVVEMVSGKQQVGDKEFKPRGAAEIAVGGDGLDTDPDAPTYTSFRPVASLTGPGANRAAKLTGQTVTATINRAGGVGSNPGLGLFPGAKLVAYDDTLGHNIPQAFWDFLNLKGPIQQNGSVVDGQQLSNWIFLMGYPITEPYWGRIKVAGVYRDAMFQLYERRSLAYVPSLPQGWQVQMGNVGSHYYRWLYGGPLPTPLVPLGTPVPTVPVIPLPVDAGMSTQNTAVGNPIIISITGFRAGEEIVSWFTAPEGTAGDARINLRGGEDGSVRDISVPTGKLYPGKWAITFHGKSSNHESIAYFYLSQGTVTPTSTPGRASATSTRSAATPTAGRTAIPTATRPGPTQPPQPTVPVSGLSLSVQPGYGSPTSQFTFSARGLSPGESVHVTFLDPSWNAVYPAGSNGGLYSANGSGQLSITLVPAEAFQSPPLGAWVFEVHGDASGLEGIIGFTLR